MSFHEVRFPEALSFGSTGGPERRTEVVTLASGHEERNSPWADSRRRYDAGVGLRALDDIEVLLAFFEARQGRLFGFRWKDWADFKSSRPSKALARDDQVLGTGDGVRREFGLVKRYCSGAQVYERRIGKPVAGSVLVGLSGDALVETVHYSVDVTAGIISLFDAPPPGGKVTAGFEFDVPVRFDADRIEVSVAGFRAGEVPRVPVVEIRL